LKRVFDRLNVMCLRQVGLIQIRWNFDYKCKKTFFYVFFYFWRARYWRC